MLGWSPEQISGRMRFENREDYVCTETIYAFIYSNGIGFQAGIQWIQEQIIFISQLISDGIPAKTNPDK